jgi:RNase P subunit RPR2
MRSIFGWSYPPGCNSVPGDEPEVRQLQCKKCKGFLSWTEPWESATWCNGEVDETGLAMCGYAMNKHTPHKEIWDAGVSQFHTCTKCGTENRF